MSAAAYQETRAQNGSIPSVTVDEITNRSVTVQEHATTTATVRSLGGTATSKNGLSAKLQSSLDRNPDGTHQSLVVIAGNNFIMECSSPVLASFSWDYCPFRTTEREFIYNDDRIEQHPHLAAKLSVGNCDRRHCAIHVSDFHVGDAGFFSCRWSSVAIKYWSITVLGK